MTTAKFFWYLNRLRAMEPAEIAERVAEKTRNWTTSSALADLEGFQLAPPVSTAPPRLPKADSAPESLRQAVAKEAREYRDSRWKLFGWKTVEVGSPPQWNHDFMHDVAVNTYAESHKLDHRDLGDGADARCVWEINRWTELVRIAQNAWLNDEPADARLVQDWLTDWCEHNPPGLGLQWTSALEVSLRLINFCWIDALIRECQDPELTLQQDALAQRIVPIHAWWTWRNRSFGSSANNHLIGELAGVVVASSRWPCLAKLRVCGERAWQALETEILRQFAPDGGNREQALHYHLFAWEMAWQAALSIGDLAAPVLPRLQKAARFFVDATPETPSWDFGDSDDAVITPFANHRESTAAEWRAWFSGMEDESSIGFWLGEPPAGKTVRTQGWKHFPETGLVVRQQDQWMARADASPLGLGRIAAHGHLDALHLSLWHAGQAVIIDPGTGAYFSDPELREQLARWEAHNGPVPVMGRDLPRRLGPFLWSGHHPTPQVKLDEAAEVCSLRFTNESSPFVRRTLSFERGNVVIEDKASCSTPHQVAWQFPAGTTVTADSRGWKLGLPGALQLRVETQSDRIEHTSVEDRTVSPAFSKVELAPCLVISFVGSLTTTFSEALDHS